MASEMLPGREFAYQSVWQDGDLVVGQAGQLGGAAQVLRELRVPVLLRDGGLMLERVRVDPQVRQADLARPHGIHGQALDRPARQRPDPSHVSPSRDSSSGGAPGTMRRRSSSIRAITVVW